MIRLTLLQLRGVFIVHIKSRQLLLGLVLEIAEKEGNTEQLQKL